MLSCLFVSFSSVVLEGEGVINLTDRKDLAERRPILIAHRGGIVADDAPECSMTAIKRASERGYDMVELDVQLSRDGVPMVFHDCSLEKACGRPGQIKDLLSNELEEISYLNSKDQILSLDTALSLCSGWNLGVMLDFKSGQENDSMLKLVDTLIVKHQLQKASISITGSDKVRGMLKHVWFTPTDVEMARLRSSKKINLSQRFWFGLPKQLRSGDIERLKTARALIFPAINTFRYPDDQHAALALKDIQKLLKAGVDGFQIDSVYDSNFDKVTNVNP